MNIIRRYLIHWLGGVPKSFWEASCNDLHKLNEMYSDACCENHSLKQVFSAAQNLVNVKGAFHSQQAYEKLVKALEEARENFEKIEKARRERPLS